ncbi:Alpha-galactosidase mel1 [Glycine max]|nr:Alpha-galactosidase mel1 [Glycine max]
MIINLVRPFYKTYSVSSQNAITPPRGWNSYDSFSWIISEEEYLQNANIISQKLLPYGYQYAIVDYLWYRSLKGDSNSLGFDMIDKWGRMLPDPERWPSSRGGGGFTEVANKVHSMGLKFGIHLMAGISTQAYNKNTPILDTATGQPYMESGRVWNAKDIGIPSRACKWMTNGFMAINAKTGAGKAFLRSIYELYASWGVDFVKLDCVFGEDLDLDEITFVSEFFNGLERPIVFSLSPGVSATPLMANSVSSLVNTYRVTGDDWDEWSAILAHFNVARDFAASNLIGGKGLKGKSWPDLDMLPFGWLTDPAAHEGPHRATRLTQDEQRTQFPHITRLNDVKTKRHNATKVQFTYSLALTECTDPKAYGWSSEKHYQDLERIYYKRPKHDLVEPFCMHKGKLPIISSHLSNLNITLVNGHSGMCAIVEHVLGETYVAFFNLNNEKTTISASIVDLAMVHPGRRKFRLCSGNEMWSGRTIQTNNMFSAEVQGV